MNPYEPDNPERQDSSAYYLSETPETVETPAQAEPVFPKLPLSVHRAYMTRVGLGFSLLAVLFVACGYGFSYLALLLKPELLTTWWFDWVLSLVPLYAIALPCMLLILRTIPAAPHNGTYPFRGAEVRKPRFRFGWWIVLFIICVGYLYIGSLISNGLMNLLSAITGKDYADILQSMTADAPLWLIFLATVVIAPIGEEFMFRKLLIDRARQYGDTAAILLSAAMFALFHRNFFQLIYTFLIGLILAYVYTRTGKYWLSVSLHAAGNFVGGVLSKLMISLIGEEALESPETLMELLQANPLGMLAYYLYTMMIYSALIASVVLTIVLFRKRKLSRGTQSLTRGETASVMYLNAGILLFIVLCLGLTVFSLVMM